MNQSKQAPMRLRTLEKAARELEMTVESLRWLRFKSKERRDKKGNVSEANGFSDAFVNIGRRVYLDVDGFLEIVAAKNGRGISNRMREGADVDQ